MLLANVQAKSETVAPTVWAPSITFVANITPSLFFAFSKLASGESDLSSNISPPAKESSIGTTISILEKFNVPSEKLVLSAVASSSKLAPFANPYAYTH